MSVKDFLAGWRQHDCRSCKFDTEGSIPSEQCIPVLPSDSGDGGSCGDGDRSDGPGGGGGLGHETTGSERLLYLSFHISATFPPLYALP